MTSFRVLVLTALFVAACSASYAETGRADLRGTAEGSALSGFVTLHDTPEGLSVHAEISGATPGDHGFHIHQYGACGDSGKAAGDHYNPAGAPHGLLMKDGFEHAHAGDMGNFTVGADGKGTLEATLPGVCLSGCDKAVAGRAIIFHEKADDFGQPTGNAGARTGCGPIFLVKENG